MKKKEKYPNPNLKGYKRSLTSKEVDAALERIYMKPKKIFSLDPKTGKFKEEKRRKV